MMERLVVLLFFSTCLTKGYSSPDNQGKEFIIGFMENFHQRDISSAGIRLFITTRSECNVTVQVTAPNFKNLSLNVGFNISAGKVKEVQLSSVFKLSGTEMSEKGILVEASEEIIIYGINTEIYSNDGFLGLPTDVLGTEYYAATYAPAYMYCLILIVGVYDDTEVRIKLPVQSNVNVTFDGNSYGRGETFIVIINRFTTFQINSTEDLTGTFVSANNTVSVFSGNKKTTIGKGISRDHLVEQLMSVDKWGKRFTANPTPERIAGDKYRFIASENDTNITIKGQRGEILIVNDHVRLSRPGEWKEKTYTSGVYLYVESDRPLLVVQYVLSQTSHDDLGDPSMIMLTPVEQFAAAYTFTTPKYSKGTYFNYFLFVVKKQERYGLRINGNPIPRTTKFNQFPGTDYVGGFLEINDGTYQCSHGNPTSVFGAVLFGRQYLESYGFPAGLRLAPINKPCINTTMVPGDGYDNDCDGLIDEEICFDQWKNKDEDKDGLIDEDCVEYQTVYMTQPEALSLAKNGVSPTLISYLEIGFITVTTVILVGLSVCLCKRFKALLGRRQRNDKEEEQYFKEKTNSMSSTDRGRAKIHAWGKS